jgi:hypothetical protein
MTDGGRRSATAWEMTVAEACMADIEGNCPSVLMKRLGQSGGRIRTRTQAFVGHATDREQSEFAIQTRGIYQQCRT